MKTSYPKLSFKAGMISLTTASGSLPEPVGSKILMDLLGQVWEEPIIAKRKKPKNILSFMIFFILKNSHVYSHHYLIRNYATKQ